MYNDLVHGKEVPPINITVKFLDSYVKSIVLAGRYTIEEIVKGKMIVMEAGTVGEDSNPCSSLAATSDRSDRAIC